MLAFEQGRPLRDMLVEDERVTKHLSLEQIDAMLQPEVYTGLSAAFVDRVAGPPNESQS
jgi:adenylosuccinate lyase